MIIERNGMECWDPSLELLFDLVDKISKNRWNIYKWNQFDQTILDIDFDWTLWNEIYLLTYWRFGISKYDQYSIFRNTLKCQYTKTIKIVYFRIDGC